MGERKKERKKTNKRNCIKTEENVEREKEKENRKCVVIY